MKDSIDYIGQSVSIKIDRPLHSRHPEHGFTYLLNYGCLPGVMGKDGEELDAYVLGVEVPLQSFTGKCIAVIKRIDDEDDKLILAPEGVEFSIPEIRALTLFQEKWFQLRIYKPNESDDLTATSVKKAMFFDRGNPNFDSPPSATAGGVKAISQGDTRYGDPMGSEILRKQIAESLTHDLKITYHPRTEILVTSGAALAISTAILTVSEPGDEVLTPNPGWPTYLKMISGLGRRVALYPMPFGAEALTPARWREALETALGKNPRTRLIILNSPHNPTGVVLGREYIEVLKDFLLAHPRITLLSDETYRHFVYDGQVHVSPLVFPELKGRTVLIHSFSKSFLMAGWRIAYVAAGAQLIEKMTGVHVAMNCGASSISQAGALAALEDPKGTGDFVRELASRYEEGRNLLVEGLTQLEQFKWDVPQGTFYLFANISRFGLDSQEFCRVLQDKENVFLQPGSSYGEGGEGYVRISFAAELSDLKELVNRLSRFSEQFNSKYVTSI